MLCCCAPSVRPRKRSNPFRGGFTPFSLRIWPNKKFANKPVYAEVVKRFAAYVGTSFQKGVTASGNALTKYPAAIHSDNLEKALFYYAEALQIRSAEDWPIERAVTLLNYVAACWDLGLAENDANRPLFEQMVAYATEAGRLTHDPTIIREAENQLEKLEELGLAHAQENSL